MISIAFADARFARARLRDRFDLLLGVEATLTVAVNARLLYVEPMFAIVELRAALAAWLASEPKLDFEFDSMEFEEHGVLWFRQRPSGVWRVGSVFQDLIVPGETSLADLVAECRGFVDAVDGWVREHLHLEVEDVLAQ
jgi:hypothetical protein